MTIVIMFKNGKELRMKCDNFKVKSNMSNDLTGWEYTGATENALTWLDMNEVLCVYRVMSDEVKE